MIHRVEAPAGIRPRGPATPTVLPRGAVVQGYEIMDFVAAGGMSRVYVARRDGERFLLKEVEGSEGRHVIALNQEKFTLERLDHPGIVRVFDLFELDGFYYLVLEFIAGQSLDKLASPHLQALLEEKVVLDWALQLCDIFAYLHSQDPPIIYRDLKPDNVIRDLRGRIRLVDFGVSRSLKDEQKARDTVLAGSTLTASPEHFGATQTDVRSDIFSLGATLSLLLTNGRSPLAEPFKFMSARTINPTVSENLDLVIQKATRLDPRERYQSMAEVRQALLNCRSVPLPVTEPFGETGRGQTLPPDGPRPPESRGLALILSLLGMLLVTALGISRLLAPAPASVAPSSPSPEPVPTSTPGAIAPSLSPAPVSPATVPPPSPTVGPKGPPPSLASSPIGPKNPPSPAPVRPPPALASAPVGSKNPPPPRPTASKRPPAPTPAAYPTRASGPSPPRPAARTYRVPEGELTMRAPVGFEPTEAQLEHPGFALRKQDRLFIVQVLEPDGLEQAVLGALNRRAQERGLQVQVDSPTGLDLSSFPGARRAMAVSQDSQTGIVVIWMTRRLSTGRSKGYAIASAFESNPGWPQLMQEAGALLAGIRLPP